MINNADWVEGIYVRFRDVSAGSLTYNLITVLNTDATSYTVPNLQKFTKYDFFLVPFFKSVEGQPSNSMAVQTSEDGMCIRYLFKILVYEFLIFVVLFYFQVPSVPPESVQIGIVNETTAFVKWLPPKVQQLNGVLQGFKVPTS